MATTFHQGYCYAWRGDPCRCHLSLSSTLPCYTMDSDMERALMAFLDAGQRLVESWDDTKVRHYPYYLPSFDDFMSDFARLIEEEKP